MSLLSRRPLRERNRLFAHVVQEGVEYRPIEEYCTREGAKLFVQDLKAANRFLAKRLVEEAGVSLGGNNEGWIFKSTGYTLLDNVIDSRHRIVRDWMELVE